MGHPSKWVRQIVELQHDDGSWGGFHTLSLPTAAHPITTEQALRRLRILGLGKGDAPIDRALAYMERNLAQPHPTVFQEKTHDAKTFGDLMLAAWIRQFDPCNGVAQAVAVKWARIIGLAFGSGAYSHAQYVTAYEAEFGKLNPKSGRLADFVCFYQLALLPSMLAPPVESAMLDRVLAHPCGIFYIYESAVNDPPAQFASRAANRYIAALELLSAYALAPTKLRFAVEWLLSCRGADGQWDLGAVAKDGIHFPLSDSWRRPADRKRDCTARIAELLRKLG